MPVRNKVFLFLMLLGVSVAVLKAQEKVPTLAGMHASFVSSGLINKGRESGITDQRRTYLQAFAMRNSGERLQLGLHLGYLESSMDQRGVPGMTSPFVLERTQAFSAGVIQRFNRQIWQKDLVLFFQSTLDIESANRRRIESSGTSREKGLGFRFQLRPGLQWHISEGFSLEFGFGLLNLSTLQYFDGTISAANRSMRESNLDVSFGGTSVFLGLSFKL
jgi:hypothetical protein